MLFLSDIEIVNFRNLNHFKSELSEGINVIYGENGSGKTSFLEALYHLSVGRSFRTHFPDKIIQKGKEKFLVSGKINNNTSIGIERDKDGGFLIKYARKSLKSISELAFLLPMQIVNSDSYSLLNSGPKARRQFIDWGVFHVEHSYFFDKWKEFQRIVKQRNSAIRQKSVKKIITSWDKEFVDSATYINERRKEYFLEFETAFKDVVKSFFPWKNDEIAFEYHSGWKEKDDLENILLNSIDRDMILGFTQNGPHRADFRIFLNGLLVQDVLSRGQQKMLVCAMKIAQIILLSKKGKKCILLIDDLPSELDTEARMALFEIAHQLDVQVFITGIEQNYFDKLYAINGKTIKMFHVKHFDNFNKEAIL